MALCDSCTFYNAEYDNKLQIFDDVLKIDEKKQRHHCPMYDGKIPENIFYDNGECEFYIQKASS